MKKRLIDCPVHGLTLFRCKRKYRKKDKETFYDTYKERCFKCIGEKSSVAPVNIKKQRKIHVKV